MGGSRSQSEANLDELEQVNRAHQEVVDALKYLSPNARTRVIQSVITLLGGEETIPHNPGEQLSTRIEDVSSRRDFSTDRTLSPKAFLLEKMPKTDVERVACLSYYLTHFRDTPHFKTVEISKLNTEAAQQKFSNPSQSVNNAAKLGYLVSAPKGQKQLSGAGELFVQALPDRNAAKEAMTRVRPRRGGRKKGGKVLSRSNA